MIRAPWKRQGTALLVGETVAAVAVTDRIAAKVVEAMNGCAGKYEAVACNEAEAKLQQLHARLEVCPSGTATRRDLRDLVACFIEPEATCICPLSKPSATCRVHGAATDVDAAVARLHAGLPTGYTTHWDDVNSLLRELARLRQQVIDAGRELRIAEDYRVKGEAQNNRLVAEVKRQGEEFARLRARLEQTEVQLAGCSAAALGHGESAKPGDYGWSASYGDVLALRLRGEAKPEPAGREVIGYAVKAENGNYMTQARDWSSRQQDAGRWSGPMHIVRLVRKVTP